MRQAENAEAGKTRAMLRGGLPARCPRGKAPYQKTADPLSDIRRYSGPSLTAHWQKSAAILSGLCWHAVRSFPLRCRKFANILSGFC